MVLEECTDVTISVGQFVGKVVKHRTQQYVTSVDLKKSYNSVP